MLDLRRELDIALATVNKVSNPGTDTWPGFLLEVRRVMSGSRSDLHAQRAYDARRQQDLPYRKWYRVSSWQNLRARRLAADPLCTRCLPRGVTRPAAAVNHIKPHKGDRALFFCFANTESVCTECHNRDIQREEVRGYAGDVGLDGWPTDPRHPANASGRGGR